MHTPWIPSSIALPPEGQPVEFVLDHRQIAIEGTYTRQVFRSRWTSYEVERVGTWRLADLLHAQDHAAA
jgi:hypothetical protein